MLITMLATIFVLGILIVIHELGHFVVAKSVDIKVPRFSIGLGPRLIGIKRGETDYCLSAIPFGGYVKMAGETSGEFIEGGDENGDNEAATAPSPRDFDQKPVWARLAVVSAGSIMNYAWGFLLFFILVAYQGISYLPVTSIGEVDWGEGGAIEELKDLKEGDHLISVSGVNVKQWDEVVSIVEDETKPLSLRWMDVDGDLHEARIPAADKETRERLAGAIRPAIPARVGEVRKESPADKAGFQRGDVIFSIEGIKIDNWSMAVRAIKVNPERELDVKVRRGEDIVDLKVTPERKVVPANGENYQEVGQIGILNDLPREQLSLPGSLVEGARESYYIAAYVLITLKQLVTGEISPKMLGGPVMIGQLAGNRARWGFSYLLRFMALFSINLAVLNMLPIPVLDGGHVLFLLIEKVQGRPVSEKVRLRLSQVGMILLILMMVYVTANDGLRLFNIY
jgi:regulator of sigma E protease